MRMKLAALLGLAALGACKPAPAMKPYDYPAWGFSIAFWSAPQVTETPAAAGQPHSLLLESNQAGRQFAVDVVDGVKPGVTIDAIGPDAAQRMARVLEGEVGPETYAATSTGVLGREYLIKRNGNPYATMRAFIAGGRFYELGAQSVLGTGDPAVKAFLDSFRITAPASTPANAAPTNSG